MSADLLLEQGSRPLLVSLPHCGTGIPDALIGRYTERAQSVPDTDWHVERLYAVARALGASVLTPRWSRYVVDLNRPPDGAALYPGQSETGLVPTTGFDGEPLYRPGAEPDVDEMLARRERYWRPYHEAIATELARLRERHGRAVLWDGHSIRSVVPRFFEGRLPDFNLGTADGRSCSPGLADRLGAVLAGQGAFSHVVNGRFKGGYITRHYGRPDQSIDAVQLELAQCIYMDEDRFTYDDDRAQPVQRLIERLLETCLAAVA